ncbi:TraR/DksA C4-type zinc finger protein [Oceanirhabdus sp. W0125-5]|uniref:TraR/DksA C4-type zinc finger protein n=1 Tax=Oceanirhabdus sp. W0125-5 TaxID=2999116 RepID=UPI0022F33282|nr:TraR/DksA C4-type zinc finger protein [Oceanirhabdus sp. W0125-5]WBW95344.1 TraR/DksA C4-type zinc finger protein [Oceanirhabdus sp. W0125-5]
MAMKNYQIYKDALLKEKERVESLLQGMDKGIYMQEIGGELAVVDNHPADIGEEMAISDTARALRGNENKILNKIDNSLKKIEDGTYGICPMCSKTINKERLEFMPYAEYCIKCQNDLTSVYKNDFTRRPLEEQVLEPFNYGYNDFKDDPGFDAEDTYQAVESFNRQKNLDDYYYDDDEYVEGIEAISNGQYRHQLY